MWINFEVIANGKETKCLASFTAGEGEGNLLPITGIGRFY